MIRRITPYFVFVVTLLLLGLAATFLGAFLAIRLPSFSRWISPVPPVASSLGPTVTELENLGELVATKVHLTDVLEAKGLGHRGLWLVKGDALIGIDMSKARVDNKDVERRTATIILPEPRIVAAHIDHEKTKTFDFTSTTWLPWKKGDQGILRDHAMLHAQRLVEFAARREEGLERARQNCAQIVRGIYQQIGWNVDIHWPESGSPSTDATVLQMSP